MILIVDELKKKQSKKYIQSCPVQRIVSHYAGSQIKFMFAEYKENDENIENQTTFDHTKLKQQ